jgi:methanogenic corrinoid protein MtbC1
MKINAEVLRRMEKYFPNKYRSALVYGPFTVAGQLIGEEKILKGILKDPEGIINIIEHAFECARLYALYLIEAGANLLWISDPLSALIPPAQFQIFASDFLRKLFELFDYVPTILHICGDTYQIIQEMVSTGVKGISFDNCMDLLAVEDQIPEDIYIIGNVDPVEVIELGSPERVVSCTLDLISIMAIKDNFILSTGCAVPPFAPLKNIRLFVDTAKRSFHDLRSHTPLLSQISQNVYIGNGEATKKGVENALDVGVEPLKIITSGLIRTIRKASALYETKKLSLPGLLLMVDAFYKGFQVIEDKLKPDAFNNSVIVIGTVKGDIHEIGKGLVRIFLEIHGYKVIDLGVDVPSKTFVNAYRHYRPSIIGLSAFTSASRREMPKIIQAFRKEGIGEVIFIIGGAAVNSEFARSIGAHGYARDAIGAVSLVRKLLRQSKIVV